MVPLHAARPGDGDRERVRGRPFQQLRAAAAGEGRWRERGAFEQDFVADATGAAVRDYLGRNF